MWPNPAQPQLFSLSPLLSPHTYSWNPAISSHIHRGTEPILPAVSRAGKEGVEKAGEGVTETRRDPFRRSMVSIFVVVLELWMGVLLSFCFTHALPTSSSTECIPTTSGCLFGSIANSSSGVSVSQFLGIPFAEPPIGSDRWRSPRPFDDVNSKRNVSSNGPMCTQYSQGKVVGQEDCLYLNVWVPTDRLDPVSGANGALLPVVMWIYGGAFISGSNGIKLYNGVNFVARNSQVILVAPNYRLGPFGFLSLNSARMTSPTNSSGNWGLEDQREAMRWIQMNIRSFGGDPNRVTLWGESAGSISTCLHVLSPLSAGFFHSAIIESGPCDLRIFNNGPAEIADQFVQSSGCNQFLSPSDELSCLQNLNTSQVMEIGLKIDAFEPFGGAVLTRSFFPTVDGYNIPREPIDMFKSGDFNKVSLIAGSCSNEAAIFVLHNPAWLHATSEVLAEVVSQGLASITSVGNTSEIYNFYVPSTRNFGGNDRESVVAFLSDLLFICGSRRILKYMYDAGVNDLYLYNWNLPSFGWLGAFHASDLPFFFGNPPTLLGREFSTEEAILSKNTMDYVQRFISFSASPNTVVNPLNPPTLVWPRFSPSSRLNMELNSLLSVQVDHYSDRCDMWDTALGVSWSNSNPNPNPNPNSNPTSQTNPTIVSQSDSVSLGIGITGLILSLISLSTTLLIIRNLMNAAESKSSHSLRAVGDNERFLSSAQL